MLQLRTRAGTGSALVLLAGLALSSPAQAGAQSVTLTNRVPATGATTPSLTGTSDPVSHLDFETSIREIYGRYADVLKASGADVRFAISKVQTRRSLEFESVTWAEIASTVDGASVSTKVATYGSDLPSQEKVSYWAEWHERPSPNVQQLQEREADFASLSLRQVLAVVAESNAERYAAVTAVSSYEVRVDLAGRSRSYRANIYWKPVATDKVLFSVVDLIVPDLAMAFEEDRDIVKGGAEWQSPTDSGSPGVNQAASRAETCTFSQRVTALPRAGIYGFHEHESGYHESVLNMTASCKTTTTCTSHCFMPQASSTCTEWGAIAGFRRFHTMAERTHGISTDGLGPGLTSECGYTQGCAIRSCSLFEQCLSIQFALSGKGAQVALRSDPPVPIDLSVQKGAVCPAARPIDDRDGPPCGERTPGLVALDLHGQGEPISLGPGAVRLRRLEPSTTMHHGHTVSYLMGEWALVLVPGASGGGVAGAEVQGATVEDFGAGVVAGLSDTLSARLTASASGQREALVVAVPLHEPNSRRIPLPALQLEAGAAPISVPATHWGRALLLADFGEDHTLQELSILHSTALVSRELALHFERSLKLTPQTAEPHRVVAFVLVDVGAKLEIVSQLMYLPRCCCGDYFCQ
jgi:hypothetical protein